MVKSGNGDTAVGLLDKVKIRERIDIEVFRRRQAIEFKRSRNKIDKKQGQTLPA